MEVKMSALRQILTLVGDTPRSDAVVALAARLAKQHGATLRAVHAVEPLNTGAYLSPESASVAAQWVAETEEKRRNAAAERVAKVARAAGIEIPLTLVKVSSVAETLNHAWAADLIVLAQRDPQGADGTAVGFAGQLLVGAGCPLLFIPYVETLPLEADGAPRCANRVLVAWAPRRESVRALRDALPLLRNAASVELVCFCAPDEADEGLLDAVVAYLKHHGVTARARVSHTAEPSIGERLLSTGNVDVPVAEALLSMAADAGADLIVMGGYGHARTWELVLGGVTRTMLRSMTVPVLMSH
jgi:nucleotide-binding universal stress UspA family protein